MLDASNLRILSLLRLSALSSPVLKLFRWVRSGVGDITKITFAAGLVIFVSSPRYPNESGQNWRMFRSFWAMNGDGLFWTHPAFVTEVKAKSDHTTLSVACMRRSHTVHAHIHTHTQWCKPIRSHGWVQFCQVITCEEELRQRRHVALLCWHASLTAYGAKAETSSIDNNKDAAAIVSEGCVAEHMRCYVWQPNHVQLLRGPHCLLWGLQAEARCVSPVPAAHLSCCVLCSVAAACDTARYHIGPHAAWLAAHCTYSTHNTQPKPRSLLLLHLAHREGWGTRRTLGTVDCTHAQNEHRTGLALWLQCLCVCVIRLGACAASTRTRHATYCIAAAGNTSKVGTWHTMEPIFVSLWIITSIYFFKKISSVLTDFGLPRSVVRLISVCEKFASCGRWLRHKGVKVKLREFWLTILHQREDKKYRGWRWQHSLHSKWNGW